MVTYLVGTDGIAASQEIADFLKETVNENDRLEVVNVLTGGDDEEARAGENALELFEERFGEGVAVETHQIESEHTPAEDLLETAQRLDADQIVTGLRRHSQTERIIFGSVAYALLKRTTIPIALVPLGDQRSASEYPTKDLKYMY